MRSSSLPKKQYRSGSAWNTWVGKREWVMFSPSERTLNGEFVKSQVLSTFHTFFSFTPQRYKQVMSSHLLFWFYCLRIHSAEIFTIYSFLAETCRLNLNLCISYIVIQSLWFQIELDFTPYRHRSLSQPRINKFISFLQRDVKIELCYESEARARRLV